MGLISHYAFSDHRLVSQSRRTKVSFFRLPTIRLSAKRRIISRSACFLASHPFLQIYEIMLHIFLPLSPGDCYSCVPQSTQIHQDKGGVEMRKIIPNYYTAPIIREDQSNQWTSSCCFFMESRYYT